MWGEGGSGGTVRARVHAGEDTLRGAGRPRATPAISRAPASAELERASRSHAGFAPLAPPPPPSSPSPNKTLKSFAIKESVVSFPLPFKRSLCIGNQLSLAFVDILQCGLPWK